VDLVWIQLADFDQLFDLRYANFSTRCDHRIEIPRRHPVDEIPGFVSLPRFHKRHLSRDSRLEHVFLTVEFFRFLAFCEFRSEASPGVESRNSSAAGAQPFRERSLWDQLQLEFAG
jgi:hypothetical protein